MAKKILIVFVLIVLSVFGITKGVTKAFPVRYSEYVEYYAQKSNIDPLFVLAIIRVESNFDENATSKKGAKGLMQIMDSTALWVNQTIKIDDFSTQVLYEPEQNIRIGMWYLEWLKDRYNDIDLVITAYNAGHGNIDKWLSNPNFTRDGKSLEYIPFEETRNYLLKVKFTYNVYKIVYKDLGWLARLVTQIKL